jgi:hypothetical protein
MMLSEEDLVSALKTARTGGLHLHWIREKAPVLLDLSSVRNRMSGEGDPTDRQRLDALADLLRELVQELDPPECKLLTIMLGLEPRYLAITTAKERREIAGKEFRDGFRVVQPDTIRLVYELPAVKHLARHLYEEEQRARITGTAHTDGDR